MPRLDYPRVSEGCELWQCAHRSSDAEGEVVAFHRESRVCVGERGHPAGVVRRWIGLFRYYQGEQQHRNQLACHHQENGPTSGNMIVKFNSCTSTRSRQVSTCRPLLRFGAAPCARTASHGSPSRYNHGVYTIYGEGTGTRLLLPRRCMSGFGVLEAGASATQRVHRHQHRPGGRGTPP